MTEDGKYIIQWSWREVLAVLAIVLTLGGGLLNFAASFRELSVRMTTAEATAAGLGLAIADLKKTVLNQHGYSREEIDAMRLEAQQIHEQLRRRQDRIEVEVDALAHVPAYQQPQIYGR